MLKTIWDTVTGNYRYIKYDGSEFHRKAGWSILDRPETKIGLTCVAFNMAVISFLNHDLSHIFSGEFSQISNLTKEALRTHMTGFVIGTAFSAFAVHPYIVYPRFPKKDKAIDTYGTDLSRAQLSLKDIEDLKQTRLVTGALSALHATVIAISAFTKSTGLDVSDTILFTTYFMAFERSSKILNGQYVICDTPPRKRQAERKQSSVFGGIKTP